jgi:hypothetical protein
VTTPNTPATEPPPPRRIIADLNPNLTDSPLRRALHAAGLDSPFGIADGDCTELETPSR